MISTLIFLHFLLLGLVLGILYDIFKILRNIFQSNVLIFFIDVTYFLICSIITFVLSVLVNSGNMRYFTIQGELLGIVLYKMTLSRIIFKIIDKIVSICKKITKNLKSKMLKFNKKREDHG